MDGSSHEGIEPLRVAFKHFFGQPPENEQGCGGEQKGDEEEESALDVFWLVHVVGFGKMLNFTCSKSIGRLLPDSHREA